MIKIWWYKINDEFGYEFKIYYKKTIIISQIHHSIKGGNKKKSGNINIISMFFSSDVRYVSSNLIKKPELYLWDVYMSSFKISEKIFNQFIDKKITAGCLYKIELENLKKRI